MSTDFWPLAPIRVADLFDGRLQDVGVNEHHNTETMATNRCLTDGQNFLWVHIDDSGFVSSFSRYAMNKASRILKAIVNEFQVDIVSEYAVDVAWHKLAEKDEQVAQFIRGESRDLKPGTIEIATEIAKRLVAESPDLMTWDDKWPNVIKAVTQAVERSDATHEGDVPF